MVQSESSKKEEPKDPSIPMPKRHFTIEFVVGVFTVISFLAFGYLSVGLGELELSGGNKYTIYAEFDNVAGLKYGASVEIAGVQIGDVTGISLKDSNAIVELRIDRGIQLKDDDVAMIRTKGIIGDRYVKISRGGSETMIKEGETMLETESVVDFEDIVGKIVHSLTSDDEESTDKALEKKEK